MRNAFIEHLMAKVDVDESLFLVVGDLGYSVVDPFVEKHPRRFLNAGIAEQNMTAVASGLAREGYKVFTYSIANFTTLRCLEQIRIDVCYHNLPVCIVSVGGGFMYGSLGPSHHATEDIAILRAIPNMRVFVPFSRASACTALDEVVAEPGPAYIRLGREDVPCDEVAGNGLTRLQAGKASTEQAIISVGKIGKDTLRLAGERGADLFALCRINPLPSDELEAFFSRYKHVTVIEDHQRAGGVFSALSEYCSSIGDINIGSSFSPLVGSEDDQRKLMLFDGGHRGQES